MTKLSTILISLMLIVGAYGVINFITDQWIQIILSNEIAAPKEMSGHSAVLNPVNNTMVIFGGHSNKMVYGPRIYRYDLVADSWFINDTTTSDIPSAVPSARWGHVAVTTPYNTMYVFGGTNGSALFNDIYKYDMIADQWMKIVVSGTPPTPRFGHTGVMYPITNEFVFFGGQTALDKDHKTNDLVRFNFETNTWSPISRPAGTPPTPRVGHTAIITLLNQMIVFGGADLFGTTNTTHSYDCVNDQWVPFFINTSSSSATLMPGRSYHGAVLTALHQMLVFGGLDQSGDPTFDTFKLDFTQQQWISVEVNDGEGPSARYGHSATGTLFNTMMVFGGQSSTSSFYNDIFKYNVVSSVLRSSTDGVVLVVLLSLVGTLIIGLCFALDLMNEKNERERYIRMEEEAIRKGTEAELEKFKSEKDKQEFRQPLFEKF